MQYEFRGKLTNKILRSRGGKIYYFDESGIYRSVLLSEVYSIKLDNLSYLRPNGEIFSYWLFIDDLFYVDDIRLVIKAISMLKEGDTIEKFKTYLDTVELENHSRPSGLDRFITKIERPEFERIPTNPNKNTFDYIFVEVNIVQEWEGDRLTYIKKHKKQIFEMVLKKVQESKRFKKYGIPINFLKFTRVTLKRNSVLEFVLELKVINN